MAHREAAPLLTPIDPTTTGESDVTRAVRDALKRKREAEAAAAAGASSASAAWVAPTAAAKTCVHEVAVPSGFAGDREALLSPRYDGPPAKEYPFVLDPFQKTAVACLVRPGASPVVPHAAAAAQCDVSLSSRPPAGRQERRESVLVAAHTSAGKTVVAECAPDLRSGLAVARFTRSYGSRALAGTPSPWPSATNRRSSTRRRSRCAASCAGSTLPSIRFARRSRCFSAQALSNQKYRELAEEFEDVGLMTGDTSIAPHATCVVMARPPTPVHTCAALLTMSPARPPRSCAAWRIAGARCSPLSDG